MEQPDGATEANQRDEILRSFSAGGAYSKRRDLWLLVSARNSETRSRLRNDLNESKHLSRWCDVNNVSLIHLPSRKGSRQGWTLAVATAVMMNAEAYASYMHDARADDQDLNKLISRSWDAVQDRYFIAAVSARAFVDVVFAKPLNFFVHSDFSTRHDLSAIMSCAGVWINGLSTLEEAKDVPAPAVDSLSELILAKFPQWRDEYAWWYDGDDGVGTGIGEVYKMAVEASGWHRVKSHLHAAHRPMLKTHQRNLDGDCSMNVDVKHAPKVSDDVEDGFGCLDFSLSKTRASVESAAGNGQSMKMGAMKNDHELLKEAKAKAAENQERWEAKKSKKRHRGGGGGGETDAEFDYDAEVGAILKQMKMTSWRNSIPRKERWLVIKDLQKHLRAHGKERREKRQLLADKALARKRAGVQKAAARRLRAVLDYRKHDRIEPITTPQGLAALKADHGDSHGNYADALRDQIRVRKYVYGMGDLPAIGGGSSDGELARLELAVGILVGQELGEKMPEPNPEFRPHDHSTSTDGAKQKFHDHIKQVVAAYRGLIALTEKGVFRLPVGDGEDDDGESTSSSGSSIMRASSSSSSSSSTATPRPRKARRVKAKETAMVGQSFEDDGTNWKVLDVVWSDVYGEVVVYYYDMDSVNAEGIEEKELMDSLDDAGDHLYTEHIEFSKVKEVMGWLRASKAAEAAS